MVRKGTMKNNRIIKSKAMYFFNDFFNQPFQFFLSRKLHFLVIIIFILVIIGVYWQFRNALPLMAEKFDRYRSNYRIPVFGKLILENKNDECKLDTLVECDSKSPTACFNCKDHRSMCHHFETEVDYLDPETGQIKKIPSNRQPDRGYCLYLEDRGQRTCTAKNGGQWILTSDENNRYSWICNCQYPKIFISANLYADCTMFSGCPFHSKATNANDPALWNSFDEITCDCEPPHLFKPFAKKGPLCTLPTYFEALHDDFVDFVPLRHDYLDPKFASLFTDIRKRKIPDPCKIDALSGEKVLSTKVGSRYWDNIVECYSYDSRYVPVTFEHDYLLNNNGKFPNGIVKVSDSESSLLVSETHTIKDNGSYKPLIGYAFKVKDINPLIDLKFLRISPYPFAQRKSLSSLIFFYHAPTQNPNYPIIKQPPEVVDMRPVFVKYEYIIVLLLYIPGTEKTSFAFCGIRPFRTTKLPKGNEIIFVANAQEIHELLWQRASVFYSDKIKSFDNDTLNKSEHKQYFVPSMLMPLDNYNHLTSRMIHPKATGVLIHNLEKNVAYPISLNENLVNKYRMRLEGDPLNPIDKFDNLTFKFTPDAYHTCTITYDDVIDLGDGFFQDVDGQCDLSALMETSDYNPYEIISETKVKYKTNFVFS